MIIKPADDKSPQLATLEALLSNPAADTTTKRRIEQEIRNIKAGIRGEEEAAYEIRVLYGENPNWAVIHDLRIEHGGVVAQIDHLLINRCLEMWVCESKHFSEGIAINEHGEFAAFFGSKPYGVPSPIEQNNRHILILKRLFDSGRVQMPKRMGFTIKPDLNSLILVSKGARISRPKTKVDGIESVIKNDHLSKAIDKAIDEASPMTLARIVSCGTLHAFAKEIANQHKPIEFDWMAKFGLTKVQSAESKGTSPAKVPPSAPEQETASAPAPDAGKPRQKLVCHSCDEAVTYSVAKFCWINKPRFGGKIYCMGCQKTANPSIATTAHSQTG